MYSNEKRRSFLCYFGVLILGYVIGRLDTSSWTKIGSSVIESGISIRNSGSSSSSDILASIKSISYDISNISTASKRFLHEEKEIEDLEKLESEEKKGIEEEEEGQEELEEGEKEESKEGEEEEEGEEGEKVGWRTLSETIVCIVLVLISLTILFEVFKEELEEKCPRELEPILEKMFAELTVLGFLSMFSFILSKTGVFEYVGDIIFGSGEELTEIFEVIHMAIFGVMVLFVIQILILLQAAIAVQEQWMEMDIFARTAGSGEAGSMTDSEHLRDSLGDAELEKLRQELNHETFEFVGEDTWKDIIKKITPSKVFHFFFPMVRCGLKLNHNGYFNLREEFLRDRNMKYPYNASKDTLGEQFNFGKYLGVTLVETLEIVTDVTVYTWFFFAALTVGYYLLMTLVQGNMYILSWFWSITGWVVYLGNSIFELHLVKLRNKLYPSQEELAELNSVATENDGLLKKDREPSPPWSYVEMDKYKKNRNWFTKLFVDDKNLHPQHTLYCFDKAGTKVYMHVLQINIVYTGIYVALLFLSFLKFMYRETSTPYFIFYAIFSLLPTYGLVASKERVVATLTQVRSVGIYRHEQHIALVLRDQKTVDVVRTFLVVSKLHKFAKVADAKQEHKGSEEVPSYRLLFDEYEIKQIGKTFDQFDQDGSGNIDHQEFFDLMKNIDSSIEDERLKRMVSSLDKDGDGTVDKEEFLQWYAEQMIAAEKHGHGHQTSEERAEEIFELFDDDHSGSLTLSEFKKKLDVFGDFTLDEIGELVTELDRDKSNLITAEEFELLITKYEPRDMKKGLRRQESAASLNASFLSDEANEDNV